MPPLYFMGRRISSLRRQLRRGAVGEAVHLALRDERGMRGDEGVGVLHLRELLYLRRPDALAEELRRLGVGHVRQAPGREPDAEALEVREDAPRASHGLLLDEARREVLLLLLAHLLEPLQDVAAIHPLALA